MTDEQLVAAASRARRGSHSPYSGFAVGSAMVDAAGRVFTGANVENASFTLGLCAERVALFHAVTHEAGVIVSVAIVTDAPAPTPPCGACRQILAEFAPDARVIMHSLRGPTRVLPVSELLPHAFTGAHVHPSRNS